MSRRPQIMAGHFKKATKEADDIMIFYMSEEDINTWYIIIRNIGDEDAGNKNCYPNAYFLFRMFMPENFPHEPPHFYAMNHNGLYEIEKKCCISIGEFHKADYPQTIGVWGFARELANGFINWKTIGHGIALTETTVETKRKYSEESLNSLQKKHGALLKKISNGFNEYRKRWNMELYHGDLKKLNFLDVKFDE